MDTYSYGFAQFTPDYAVVWYAHIISICFIFTTPGDEAYQHFQDKMRLELYRLMEELVSMIYVTSQCMTLNTADTGDSLASNQQSGQVSM